MAGTSSDFSPLKINAHMKPETRYLSPSAHCIVHYKSLKFASNRVFLGDLMALIWLSATRGATGSSSCQSSSSSMSIPWYWKAKKKGGSEERRGWQKNGRDIDVMKRCRNGKIDGWMDGWIRQVVR